MATRKSTRKKAGAKKASRKKASAAGSKRKKAASAKSARKRSPAGRTEAAPVNPIRAAQARLRHARLKR